jgi:arylsulfatase A
MKRRTFLEALGGGCLSTLTADEKPSPNFLFVLVDDMGWHDIQPNGNTVIDTPNLERFATTSVRFTNAYAACPVCSPTRASILTGQYPARLHLTDWIPGRKQWPHARLLTPAFNQQLPAKTKTVAAALGTGGYRSASIGKWHLGGEGSLPTDHGFDLNIAGNQAGHPTSYFGPQELPGLSLKTGEFLTQRLTEEGIRFMGADRSRPFFLYQSHFTVHLPLQARQEVINKYMQRDTHGIDPVYCAMVESADDSFGQLLKALDKDGLADRTVVIFFSDNGGLRFEGSRRKPVTDNSPLRAGKGHVYEGGIREPLLIRWPGVTRPGTTIDHPVCSVDFLPTFCKAAGVSAPKADGVDISPLLHGRSLAGRPLFWHYPHYSNQGGPPAGAVRLGDWKLIEFYEDQRVELFHLPEDPGERRNLAAREQKRAKQLRDLLADWRKEVNAAMPQKNPQYDPARADQGLTGIEKQTPPV